MFNKSKKFLEGLLILSMSLFLFSCASAPTSEPMNYPLTSIFSAVEKAMSMGVQNYSVNHREFYSRPFVVKQNEQGQSQGHRERGLAKVTVLGDGRPYTIEVVVTIQRANKNLPKESLTDQDYSDERTDERLAKKLLNRIMTILDKRERDKNLVDDFRSF